MSGIDASYNSDGEQDFDKLHESKDDTVGIKEESNPTPSKDNGPTLKALSLLAEDYVHMFKSLLFGRTIILPPDASVDSNEMTPERRVANFRDSALEIIEESSDHLFTMINRDRMGFITPRGIPFDKCVVGDFPLVVRQCVRVLMVERVNLRSGHETLPDTMPICAIQRLRPRRKNSLVKEIITTLSTILTRLKKVDELARKDMSMSMIVRSKHPIENEEPDLMAYARAAFGALVLFIFFILLNDIIEYYFF